MHTQGVALIGKEIKAQNNIELTLDVIKTLNTITP